MSEDSPVSSKPVPTQQLFFQVILLNMKNKPDVGPSIKFYLLLNVHADNVSRSIGSSLLKKPGTALAAPPESDSTRSWTSSRPRVVETLWRQLPRKRLREFPRPILVLEKIRWHRGSRSQSRCREEIRKPVWRRTRSTGIAAWKTNKCLKGFITPNEFMWCSWLLFYPGTFLNAVSYNWKLKVYAWRNPFTSPFPRILHFCRRFPPYGNVEINNGGNIL